MKEQRILVVDMEPAELAELDDILEQMENVLKRIEKLDRSPAALE